MALQKYTVDIFDDRNVILNKVVSANSLVNACYSEEIIRDLKKVLNIQVLNHTYLSIYEYRASGAYILKNTKTGKKMFTVEIKITS
ncbi:TPA: hypothetical protein JI101_19365 [Acinetobacter baumannii]|nr:hypothetical protein [Acinetobacter baumannii]